MSDKAWKRFERRVAEMLPGGRRVPVADAESMLDVLSDLPLGGECKHRRRLPRLLTDALTQASDGCLEGQHPVVALGQHGDSSVYVFMKMDVLLALISRTEDI